MFLGRRTPAIIFFRVGLGCLSLWGILCGFSLTGAAQDRQPKIANEGENAASQAPKPSLPDGLQKPNPHSTGYVSGTVLDKAGAAAVGAQLRLTLGDQSQSQEVRSGANGQFFFANLSPGPFQLTIEAEGFEPQSVSGTVRAGEAYIVPVIRLAVATVMTEVRVGSTALTPVELAQVQIQEQEKQRVFGFIPNFFVSYVPDAVPLVPRQKFELAWKSSVDPFTFVGVAAIAGVQQATDDFPGYGQGMEGYAKRFGAAYADVLSGTFIGSAILPSILKQDPRYFYKGTGSGRSRFLYSVANTVICKGDNKRWQPNYSGVLGSFATGAISYLYYPSSDRDAVGLVVQNSLIRLGETAFANIMQEFIVRRFTPRLQTHPSSHP
jgi:hypothetical protein